MSSDCILIVEDEFLIAELLSSMVEDMGLCVCGHAVSAEEAVALARLHHPRFVFMDVRLNGEQDGVDAAVLIHGQVGAQVIFITGSRDAATMARIEQDHPAAILFKPITYTQLKQTVEDLSH
jgi:response regulator of citrate/malate metabolism